MQTATMYAPSEIEQPNDFHTPSICSGRLGREPFLAEGESAASPPHPLPTQHFVRMIAARWGLWRLRFFLKN